jgi:hypothetical protein
MGGKRKAYKVLVVKPRGKRPFGRLRHRWEDQLRMDLKRDWLGSVQGFGGKAQRKETIWKTET